MQDLANTVDLEMGRDQLRSVDDLTAFCTAHGLTGVTVGTGDVGAVRELREALRDACQAHTGAQVPPTTIATLEAHFRAAPLTVAVDAAGHARPVPLPGLTGIAVLVAEVGRAVLTAVADGTWPRLKACGSHSCRWVYYDHSPAGRSRWCTMSICGSRAKMRAYRSRGRP